MIDALQNVELKGIEFFRNHAKDILGGMVIGILTYFMMMSLNLVNDLDGIWHPSNFIAGDWEISLGRGLQRYADRVRFGIVSDSFNSILTLILISVGSAIIIACFDIKSVIHKGLIIVLLVANPIVCDSLSYSYMSVNFGMAYLFSVLAFCCMKGITKDWKKNILICLEGGCFLGISLAFYQAYICVTSVLWVLYIVKMITEKSERTEILRYIMICAGNLLWGSLFYLGITKALLYRAGIELSTYRGAANISLRLITEALPTSMQKCYAEFQNYLYAAKTFANLEFIDIVLWGLLIIYIIGAIMQFIRVLKSNVWDAVFFCIMLLLLPIASCSVVVIAVGNSMSELMSMGLLMSIVMLGIIVPGEGKSGFIIKRLYLVVLLVFAWFQLSAVVNDQLALKEGKIATITLTEGIVHRLYDEGYLEENTVVALVGRPADNDCFAKSTAYQMANGYAKFGYWSTEARNNKVSWEGVLSNFLGINMNLCGEDEYRNITSLAKVKEMPEYPAKESICIIDDIVVVKVSDVY